jgi:glycerol-3-phosphate dehydrogenase
VRGFEALLAQTAAVYPFVAPTTMRRLVRAYGKRVDAVLDGAKSQADLGRAFGADLSEAEVRYLAQNEWAMTGEDIVWRRSKLGLRMSKGEVAELDAYLKQLQKSPQTVG